MDTRMIVRIVTTILIVLPLATVLEMSAWQVFSLCSGICLALQLSTGCYGRDDE